MGEVVGECTWLWVTKFSNVINRYACPPSAALMILEDLCCGYVTRAQMFVGNATSVHAYKITAKVTLRKVLKVGACPPWHLAVGLRCLSVWGAG